MQKSRAQAEKAQSTGPQAVYYGRICGPELRTLDARVASEEWREGSRWPWLSVSGARPTH